MAKRGLRLADHLLDFVNLSGLLYLDAALVFYLLLHFENRRHHFPRKLLHAPVNHREPHLQDLMLHGAVVGKGGERLAVYGIRGASVAYFGVLGGSLVWSGLRTWRLDSSSVLELVGSTLATNRGEEILRAALEGYETLRQNGLLSVPGLRPRLRLLFRPATKLRGSLLRTAPSLASLHCAGSFFA